MSGHNKQRQHLQTSPRKTQTKDRIRDVKKTRPHGYPWVIPATRWIWEEDFAPAGNGDEDFKYPYVKRGGAGAGITIPISAGTRYKITILPLNY